MKTQEFWTLFKTNKDLDSTYTRVKVKGWDVDEYCYLAPLLEKDEKGNIVPKTCKKYNRFAIFEKTTGLILTEGMTKPQTLQKYDELKKNREDLVERVKGIAKNDPDFVKPGSSIWKAKRVMQGGKWEEPKKVEQKKQEEKGGTRTMAKSVNNFAKKREEFYEKLGEKMMEKIRKGGLAEWVKPWSLYTTIGSKGGVHPEKLAYRYVWMKPFSPINQLILEPGFYITFREAKELGGHVKKGAKAQVAAYAKKIGLRATDEEEDELGDPQEHNGETVYLGGKKFTSDGVSWTHWFSRLVGFPVFRIEDTEGCRGLSKEEIEKLYRGEKTEAAEEITKKHAETDERIEEVLRKYREEEGIQEVDKVSDRAFYQPGLKTITLPKISQFKDTDGYYSTKIHEHVHSTGNKLRRDEQVVIHRFGDMHYSKEELVAEMGNVFLLSTFGRLTDWQAEQSAKYLEGWNTRAGHSGDLEKNLPIAIMQATKAANLILEEGGYIEKEEPKKEESENKCRALVPSYVPNFVLINA